MTSTLASAPRATATRVAVIDDHALLAQSAAFALRTHEIDAHVVEVTTFAEIEAEVQGMAPGVVLLDFHLGALGESTELVRRFAVAGIDVIVVTGESDRAVWGACFEAGAVALVEKRLPFDELVSRIRQIVAGVGQVGVCERLDLLAELQRKRRDERSRLEPFAALTAREAEVLQRLMCGQAADDIAAATYVSIATVRSHIRAVLQKLGVNSQLAAVAMATAAHWPDRRSSMAADSRAPISA